jgi:predicted RNase H-like nuclease
MYSNDGDSVPSRWRLSPSHRELLDNALKGAQKQLVVTAQMRSAIKEICSTREKLAHEHEDSLIAFKLAVVDSANNAGIRPSPERNDLLAKLVTIYIEEYYSSAAASPDGSPQNGAQGFAFDS